MTDLHIFDRWGNKLFSQLEMDPQDSTQSWDGRFKDKDVEIGTYMWWANIYFIDGQSKIHSGDITVVR